MYKQCFQILRFIVLAVLVVSFICLLIISLLIRDYHTRTTIGIIELSVTLTIALSLLMLVIIEIKSKRTVETENRQLQRQLENINFALDKSAIVAITDKYGKITYVNDLFCEISKYKRKELIGQDHRIINSGYHSKEFMKVLRETIKSGNIWQGEIKNRAKDGTFYWVATTIVPLLDDSGKPDQYIAIRSDISKRKQAEALLIESESRFRSFMDLSPTVAYMKDEQGFYHFTNRMLNVVFGQTVESLKGKTDADWLPKEIADVVRENDLAVLRTDKPLIIQETVPAIDGTEHHWMSFKFPFVNAEGRRFVGGVSLDITDRKKSEEQLNRSLLEKEVLLKEIHHRVKNNLQIISSLLNMQARRMKDSATIEVMNDMKQRIQAMALIHEKLYQSESLSKVDLAAYLKELSTITWQTFRGNLKQVSISNELDNVDISIEKALPCGLIANELILNSLKHGFAPNQKGTIWIKLKKEENSQIRLEIGDDGKGLPPGFEFDKSSSLGLKLVRSLVAQIDGTLRVENGTGASFITTFTKN